MDWMLTHDAIGLLPSLLRDATAQELEQLTDTDDDVHDVSQ